MFSKPPALLDRTRSKRAHNVNSSPYITVLLLSFTSEMPLQSQLVHFCRQPASIYKIKYRNIMYVKDMQKKSITLHLQYFAPAIASSLAFDWFLLVHPCVC